MSNESDLRAREKDGATEPYEESHGPTIQGQGVPTLPRNGDPVPDRQTDPPIDELKVGQSETLDTHLRADGETTAPGENVAALDFLAPADRAGAVGRLGPYVVLERIGQGGMGVVLKALDERLGRIVAIKMLAPALASGALARRRFEREARAAAAVCHEHVVTIHAVDEDAGRPYLVMQFVAGRSLQEKLDRDGALGVNEIVRIGMQVARGLAAAHAKGLIHRDIKPGNLLLEHGGERVKITDFGLARAIDDASITESGVVLGTPHYMSPEQARGEPVDHRTDLFSLGSVLFAVCTGQPPFRADSSIAVLRKVSDDAPPSIRELNPDVPDWLAEIIGKLMAKDAEARYHSASELADVLGSHLARLEQLATSVTVEPSIPIGEARRGVHLARRRLAMLTGLMLMTVGVAGWIVFRLLGTHSAPVKSATLSPRQPAPPEPAAMAPASPASHPVSTSAKAAAPLAPAKITAEAASKVQAFMAAGAEAQRRGDIQKGIEAYTEAARLDPTNTKALLARAYLRCNGRVMDWPGAIADTTEVIRLQPTNAEAFEVRASARHRAGQFRRAIEDASESLRLEPNRSWAYAHRGGAYYDLGEWKHAIVDLNEFLNRWPNHPWPFMHRALAHWSLGNVDIALADVNRAIELGPGVNHFRLLRAQIFARKKDYERAKTDFEEGIRISSESEKYFAFQRRGDFEMSLSELDAAIADYTETIRQNRAMAETKDVSGYGARAHAYLARGDAERALADCEEAMRINPTASWILGYRGYANARKGEWDRAVADFDEEAKRTPNVRAGMLTAKAAALALSGRFNQAAASFDSARKFDEGFARAGLMCRGFYLDRSRGDYDEALKNLNLAEDPVWPPCVYLYRGIIYADLGQPDKALADFKKLTEIVESRRRDFFALDDFVARRLVFWLGRGEAYLVKQDVDRALADADLAVGFAPSSAEARLLRARVHDKRGKADLAAVDRRAAAELVPDPIVAPPRRDRK